MNAPISYYGGKSKLAPWIVSRFPPHDLYIEPFCGSAAVLFAKEPVRYEIVNDVDGELVNFFRVLRDEPGELVRLCTWTPYSREELIAAQQPAADALERARWYWIRSTQSFNGRVSRTKSWGISVEQNTVRPRAVRNKVDRLMACADRLRNVAVDNRDAVDVITRFARAGGVIYADPPYLFEARKGQRHASKRNGYEHELGDEAGHRRLASVLRETEATVFLSGYPHPLYEELYEGWSRIERDVAIHANAWTGTGRERATEVVWSNRPISVERDSLFEVEVPA